MKSAGALRKQENGRLSATRLRLIGGDLVLHSTRAFGASYVKDRHHMVVGSGYGGLELGKTSGSDLRTCHHATQQGNCNQQRKIMAKRYRPRHSLCCCLVTSMLR